MVRKYKILDGQKKLYKQKIADKIDGTRCYEPEHRMEQENSEKEF